jgi:hypothetical protein
LERCSFLFAQLEDIQAQPLLRQFPGPGAQNNKRRNTMNYSAKFNYFYGKQADAYSFYRIPKVLFTDPFFSKLSCEAKVLYGLMLDRMSLSIKNQWLDDQGRVYIIFTIEEVKTYMGCCRQSAVNILAELDSEKGIGLIEKKRLGFGKANIIYVKNFTLQVSDDELTEVQKIDFKKSMGQTSGSLENGLQEVRNVDFKKSEVQTSWNPENRLQEVQKTDPNYTNYSNTDLNNTNESDTDSYLSITPDIRSAKNTVTDEMDRRMTYEQIVKDNIGYQILSGSHDKERLDEIVDIILDAVCTSCKTIRIGKNPLPAECVKNRFLKLSYMHIEYVFECLDRNTTKIANIHSYLLTVLYNAPATMNHYYAAEVNHDMYG